MPTWFRVDVGASRHPKLKRLRRLLELDRKGAVGTLTLLWDHVTEYHADGVLSAADIEGIAEVMDLHSRSDDFVIDALCEAGLMDRTDDGLEVHDYMQRNGSHLREADRKRREREDKRSGASKDRPRTRRGQSADSPRTGRGRSAPTGRNVTRRDETEQESKTGQANSDSDTRPEPPAPGLAGAHALRGKGELQTAATLLPGVVAQIPGGVPHGVKFP